MSTIILPDGFLYIMVIWMIFAIIKACFAIYEYYWESVRLRERMRMYEAHYHYCTGEENDSN